MFGKLLLRGLVDVDKTYHHGKNQYPTDNCTFVVVHFCFVCCFSIIPIITNSKRRQRLRLLTINNQLSDYPNKELSGVGVTWQFCRYIDSILNCNYANNFLDLVALGECGDMMSLRSTETRYLISKGFKLENIKNPFISYMIDKNSFPLSKADYISSNPEMGCTSMGAAFFIVPFVNALTRSGTQTEKELLFKSMLDNYAFTKILSNKRGHKEGEQETILAQALRTATNVKNRQTRAEDAGMALLEAKIKENCLLQHKILLFLLKENEIEPNIRGLVANKMMAKYQRPCLVLSYSPEKRIYEGSGRGYTKTGVIQTGSPSFGSRFFLNS